MVPLRDDIRRKVLDYLEKYYGPEQRASGWGRNDVESANWRTRERRVAIPLTVAVEWPVGYHPELTGPLPIHGADVRDMKEGFLKIGVSMFATDFAMRIDVLAREAEARGFESLFVPEHTHIRQSPVPVARRSGAAEGVLARARPVRVADGCGRRHLANSASVRVSVC